MLLHLNNFLKSLTDAFRVTTLKITGCSTVNKVVCYSLITDVLQAFGFSISSAALRENTVTKMYYVLSLL